MASDLNRCEFIGRLGKDPEARFAADGSCIVNFSLAVGWKTKDKEGTEWIRVVVFGKLAEVCSEHLVKGKQVFLSGRFRTREYEKDGQKHYVSEIVADQMQMLGSKDGGQQQSAPRAAPQRQQAAPQQQATPTGGGGALADMDDNIPFAPAYSRRALHAI